MTKSFDAVPIYIIEGSTGEYSDQHSWPVCWRATKEEADEICLICQKEADDYQASKATTQDSLESKSESMFDPWFTQDYSGTRYSVQCVSDDPDVAYRNMLPDSKFGLNIFCPICDATVGAMCHAVLKPERAVRLHYQRGHIAINDCPRCSIGAIGTFCNRPSCELNKPR